MRAFFQRVSVQWTNHWPSRPSLIHTQLSAVFVIIIIVLSYWQVPSVYILKICSDYLVKGNSDVLMYAVKIFFRLHCRRKLGFNWGSLMIYLHTGLLHKLSVSCLDDFTLMVRPISILFGKLHIPR